MDLVITSGGTGLAPRDITPEAVRPLLHKEATGVMAAMHQESLSKTPFAMLGRPLAGTRNKSIILCVPGSPKAVNEILSKVLPVMPHGIILLRNKECNCPNEDCPHKKKKCNVQSKETSSSIQQQHVCPHGHVKSAASSTHKRPWARESPYPMVDMDAATRTVLDNALPSLDTVQVPLDQALGMVLAQDVYTTEPFPSFPASIKDGYAVVVEDDSEELIVIGGVMAGGSDQNERDRVNVTRGSCSKIMTGAPVPKGANAVIQVEDTEVVRGDDTEVVRGDDTEVVRGDDTERIRILKRVKKGKDIRPIGSDIASGELVLTKGTKILAAEIGLLSAIGVAHVCVHRRVNVGVLATGDELREAATATKKLKYGQIRDSNRPTLIAAISAAMGHHCCNIVDLGIAVDTSEQLRERMLVDAFEKHDLDVLITSGGVSMGELDLIKPLLESNGTVHFGRVQMKPGKPTTFATLDTNADRRALVFALPGNPVSAIVTFYLFTLPALRKMCGMQQFELPQVEARLTDSITLDPERPEYHRAQLQWNTVDHCFDAHSTGKQASSRLLSMRSANALLVLPCGEGTMSVGTTVKCILIGDLM